MDHIFDIAGAAWQTVGIVVVSTLAVASFGLFFDLLRRGKQRVRATREQGGGFVEKFNGELRGGQGSASIDRVHGAHMTVRSGKILYRPKSGVAKQIG